MSKFTREQTLLMLEQFYKSNDRIPIAKDLGRKNDLPSYNTVVSLFGSFNNCIYHLKLRLNLDRKEELKAEILEAARILGRTPLKKEMSELGFTSGEVCAYHFKGWNQAVKCCGLVPNLEFKVKEIKKVCTECGAETSNHWYRRHSEYICAKCYSSDRLYLKGLLNPESSTALAVITETVSERVLNSIGDTCIRFNDSDDFCAKFDLTSKMLGTINVKASRLHRIHKTHYWKFTINASSAMPNHYLCICINDNDIIEKVFVLPADHYRVKTQICITNNESCLKLFSEFELDPERFNAEYQNIKNNLTQLSEFRNLGEVEA